MTRCRLEELESSLAAEARGADVVLRICRPKDFFSQALNR